VLEEWENNARQVAPDEQERDAEFGQTGDERQKWQDDHLLASRAIRDFQKLSDEAFHSLRGKYYRPADLVAEMRLRRRLRIKVPRKTGHAQKIDVSSSEVCEHQWKAPQTGGAWIAGRGSGLPDQERESSDSPRLKAFCRVAPSVRFRVRAMLAARVFFLASVFNVRTSSDFHARRLEFLAISLPFGWKNTPCFCSLSNGNIWIWRVRGCGKAA
jgi:hypothetical protein